MLILPVLPTIANAKARVAAGISRNFRLSSENELLAFPIVHLRGDQGYYLSSLHLIEVDAKHKIARIAWCLGWDEPGQNDDCTDISSRLVNFTELDEDPSRLMSQNPKKKARRAKQLPPITANAPVLTEDQLNAFPLVELRDELGKADGVVHLIQFNRKTKMARVAWGEGWDEPDQNKGLAGINSKLVWISELDLSGPNLNGSRYARPRSSIVHRCKSTLLISK